MMAWEALPQEIAAELEMSAALKTAVAHEMVVTLNMEARETTAALETSVPETLMLEMAAMLEITPWETGMKMLRGCGRRQWLTR